MEARAAAQIALNTLDLTSLSDSETSAEIEDLCRRAATPHGPTAAICIYPRFVPLAQRFLRDSNAEVRVATVCVFPHGAADVDMAVAETCACVAYGADEVDTVLPYRRLMEGDPSICRAQLEAVREACGDRTLKVILETGELNDSALIRQASRLAIEAGADFIKTSTGKVAVNATLEAAAAMLDEIAASSRRCGLKIAGGVRTVADAQAYLELAADRMGPDYLLPATFRFGASGLLTALLAELDGETPVESSTSY